MECTVASDYIPPVSDYAFLYGEAFGLDLVERGTAGAFSADDATEIIAGAGEFAASVPIGAHSSAETQSRVNWV